MLNELRSAVAEVVERLFGVSVEVILLSPPKPDFGDFAFNCGALAKKLSCPAPEIAAKVAKGLNGHELVNLALQVGSYVNLFVLPSKLFSLAVEVARTRNAELPGGQKVMVEYISPNTNKPLHLGHLRNGCLGASLANILEAIGDEVVRTCLVNDRGVHICKSMLAWQRWAGGATPESSGKKGDHFVGDWYVRYSEAEKSDPYLKAQVEEMLRQWEDGDSGTRSVWAEMNGWVYDGFAQTYRRYGFPFAKTYYESDLYQLGKDLVIEGLRRAVFVRGEGESVEFVLDPKEFGLNQDQSIKRATLIRDDGTSVYLTQDLGTAVMKVDDYNVDRSIYVVGNEQIHHFQVLFAILRALGYTWADRCFHLSYGMVDLPTGKMKSREGTVVDADDLADEMHEAAATAVLQKHPELSGEEVARRAERIAMAAIKFHLLRADPQAKMLFDPKKSLSFEGDTGPYCLYAVARIESILAKARQRGFAAVESGELSRLVMPEERALALRLLELPETIQRAAASYNPGILATAVLELARSFSSFYGKHDVLSDDPELTSQRLALCQAVANGLRWGLALLGIESVDAM